VCAPLHFILLRDAPAPIPLTHGESKPASRHLLSAPFLLIGVFTVGMLAVTAALPPHMITILRGSGLPERWVIAIPAAVGAVQVFGRMLLFFFEHRFDVHAANRYIPLLIPIGLAALILGLAGHPWAAVVFVALFGMGNGMMTIVKGTAIAQYVSRENIASLNGALGPPSAVARAITPWLLGALWTAESGYARGLWLLLAISVTASLALMLAQRVSLARR
jgi:MFS family permease